MEVVRVQAPDTLLNIRGVRVVVGGSATGNGISGGGTAVVVGSAAAPVVVDIANAASGAAAVVVSNPAGSASRLRPRDDRRQRERHRAVDYPRHDDRRQPHHGRGPRSSSTAFLGGPGTVTIQRSVIRNPNSARCR